MQQYIHKAKIIAKADKPAVKRNFTYKRGNSGGCGTLILILVGICAFFFIKLIAPLLVVACLAGFGTK